MFIVSETGWENTPEEPFRNRLEVRFMRNLPQQRHMSSNPSHNALTLSILMPQEMWRDRTSLAQIARVYIYEQVSFSSKDNQNIEIKQL